MNQLTLNNATVLSGSVSTPGVSIAIENGRIVAVGESLTSTGTVIDVAGAAVIPGLIDLHVHFGAITADDKESDAQALESAYRAHRPKVRAALLARGITTIRSVGDVDISIMALRAAVACGVLRGPRVRCVGPVLTAPGGHPISTVYADAPALAIRGTREIVGEAAARCEVDRLAEAGFNGVKAVLSGPMRISGAVLRAIGDQARRRGLWFAVHTSTVGDVSEAIEAGAVSVEHGVTSGELIPDGVLARLQTASVAYVPTLAVQVARFGREHPRVESAFVNTRRAYEAGVRVGAGSDAQGYGMWFGHSLIDELGLLVEVGMSPLAALAAATSDAAAIIGEGGQLGSIATGMRADLVVVAGCPWSKIDDVRRVKLVLQDGVIVHDSPQMDR